jgi:thiamine transport system permease protein
MNIHSDFGMLWVLFAHVIMNAGYLATVIDAHRISHEQLEEAEIAGASKMQILLRLKIPLIVPAISPSLLLVALYSATSFGLIKTLGQGLKTLETEVATSALRDLDFGRAASLAALQTLLTLGLFILSQQLAKSELSEFSIDEARKASVPSVVLGWTWVVMLIAIVIPVFVQAFSMGPIAGFVGLAGQGARDLLNLSVLDAALNSMRNLAVSMLISIPVAWWFSGKRHLKFWAVIPIGVSPVVIGLAMVVLSGCLPRAVSGSWLVLPIIQSLFVVPLLIQILMPARKSLSKGILDASRMDGAGSLRRVLDIEIPILWSAIRIAIALGSLSALGEFGAASFLAFGDQATLPVVLYRLISRPGLENYTLAMTVAFMFILFAAWIVWLVSRDTRNLHRWS